MGVRASTATLSTEQVIRILDSLYEVEQTRDAWLDGVLDASAPILAGDAGIGALLYDIAGDAEFRVDDLKGRGVSPGWMQAGMKLYGDPKLSAWIIAGLRSVLCETVNDVLSDRRTLDHYTGDRPAGQIVMNGGDGSGKGCALHLFWNRSVALTEPRRDILCRITTHLATAYRLHRRLGQGGDPARGGVEAVLTPSGRVEHADGPAKEPDGRRELEQAVQRRETSRRAAALTPERALRDRQGLIAARWTLVDEYLHAGRRYVVARENEPSPRGPASLSSREQQVAALAAQGRSNKLIAYELGLAHSTVRVLMARACAKLDVSSRSELIDRLATARESAP